MIQVCYRAAILNINQAITANANILNKPRVQDKRVATRPNIDIADDSIVDYITYAIRIYPLDYAATVVTQHTVYNIYRIDGAIIHDTAIESVQYVDMAVIR